MLRKHHHTNIYKEYKINQLKERIKSHMKELIYHAHILYGHDLTDQLQNTQG